MMHVVKRNRILSLHEDLKVVLEHSKHLLLLHIYKWFEGRGVVNLFEFRVNLLAHRSYNFL